MIDAPAAAHAMQKASLVFWGRCYAITMTPQHLAMNRAFDAMKQFVVGNEAPVYELARSDPEALAFMQGLHPDYPVGWVRDPWPDEVVDPMCQSIDGKAYFSCTIGEMLASIRSVLARDAARIAAFDAMLSGAGSCVMRDAAAVQAAQLQNKPCSIARASAVEALQPEEEPCFITAFQGEIKLPAHINVRS